MMICVMHFVGDSLLFELFGAFWMRMTRSNSILL